MTIKVAALSGLALVGAFQLAARVAGGLSTPGVAVPSPSIDLPAYVAAGR